MKTASSLVLALLLLALPAMAGTEAFHDGPLIKGYGSHASVQQDFVVDRSASYRIAFDVAEGSAETGVNRGFDSVARLLNMMAADGFPAGQLQLALVVHGKASQELLEQEPFRARFGRDNPNRELLLALLGNGVEIILCGQSAAAYDIEKTQLIDGVQLALSAMSAHAELARRGYTSNPF